MTGDNEKKYDPLTVRDSSSGKEYYGGDQEWYRSNTRAYAGCGSVACANMLRILADRYPDAFLREGVDAELKRLTGETLEKSDFVELMSSIYRTMPVLELPLIRSLYDLCKRSNKVFKKIVRPSYGMSINGFIRGSLKYSDMRGLKLHAHSLPTVFCPYEKGLDFIREGLDKGGCVVMLTSLNHHPLRLYNAKAGQLEGGYDSKGVRSHFMTITGLVDEPEGSPLVKITTWGRVATVPYDKLNRSWQKMRAFTSCLYYFTPAESEAIVRADIRNSIFVLFKALAHTVFHGKRT
ncbi:MAG: hypothetical protein K5857_03215 [Lachnospiraceae bacterium]|nr:hypothetical protein [Lachnospiraceae bacterium]